MVISRDFISSSQSLLNEILQLSLVRRRVAHCGGAHNGPSCVLQLIRLLQVLPDVQEARLHVVPGTGVLWLFLGPCDLGIFVLFALCDDFLEGEWTESLNTQNGDIIIALLLSGCLQVIVNLTGAEDYFSDFVLGDCFGALVRDERLEMLIWSEVLNTRAGTLQSEHLLGRDDTEWLSEWRAHLQSQQVEVVGSLRAVNYLHVNLLQHVQVVVVAAVGNLVILVAQLQISLNSRRGVLWAIAVVSVRQEHHETVLDVPFGLA